MPGPPLEIRVKRAGDEGLLVPRDPHGPSHLGPLRPRRPRRSERPRRRRVRVHRGPRARDARRLPPQGGHVGNLARVPVSNCITALLSIGHTRDRRPSCVIFSFLTTGNLGPSPGFVMVWVCVGYRWTSIAKRQLCFIIGWPGVGAWSGLHIGSRFT